MTATKTRRTRTADTAPETLPRDLDESDVIADGERMADELAAREAAKPAPRRSRKAAPAQAETAPEAAPAAPAPRTRKGSSKAAPAQPQPPAQAVEAEKPAEDKPAQTPRLNQAEMVLAFLAQHPDEDFGPAAVSKAITPEGRKPLGVRDCLARLAKDGKVTQTADKPLRYRIAAA